MDFLRNLVKLAKERKPIRSFLLPLIKIAFDEKNLLTLLKTPGEVGLISAVGNYPASENKRRMEELQKALGRFRIKPTKLESKPAYLVWGMKPSDLFRLAQHFNQPQVLYKTKDGTAGMYSAIGMPQATVVVDTRRNPRLAISPDQIRGNRFLSLNQGFLWGRRIPFNGREPMNTDSILRLI